MSPTARFYVGAVLATALACLGSIQTALYAGGIEPTEWVGVGIATVGAAAAYLGFGAASSAWQPTVGRKDGDAGA